MNKDTNKNLKDSEPKHTAWYRAGTNKMSVTGSYTKTTKLITALYMVTDILNENEPIRHNLRILGTQIISDPAISRQGGDYRAGMSTTRIEQIVSFLDIASAISMISEMNCNILRKEFLSLRQAILETNKASAFNMPVNLSEFFAEGVKEEQSFSKGHQSIRHQIPTRIGVQKGSTLMKALSDKTRFMSDNLVNKNNLAPYGAEGFHSVFDLLKKERREKIISIIKTIGGNSAIKDIFAQINAGAQESDICGEKTLQRELVSMTKDGVLYKTGEKRWSRYFVK